MWTRYHGYHRRVGDASGYRKAAVERAVEGAGRSSVEARRAAFANDGVPEPARALIAKVVDHAYKITDADVAAATAALGDDQVFELVICAAMGEATRQLEAALAVLDEVSP
jgi:hypothetical protein